MYYSGRGFNACNRFSKEPVSKHLVGTVDQPTIKPVQRLKGKRRKIVCNYNNKLRDTKSTHTKDVKNDKTSVEGLSKNCFRM